MTLFSAAVLLFLVMDPFGNIPLFLCVLRQVAPQRRRLVILREVLIAFTVLLVFLLVGPRLLALLQISQSSLSIAGGVILFLIALKMVFERPEQWAEGLPEGEPLIVPLAVPAIAGPSAVATILLLVGQEPQRWLEWLAALSIVAVMSGLILSSSLKLAEWLGERGLAAMQRLMGLLLTALAVEMFMKGVLAVLHAPPVVH
jgi:multiple antibiotic resistance protein